MSEAVALAHGFEELVVRVVAADGAQGCRRGAEDVDFVFFEDSPEGGGVGRSDWFAFEEDGCRTGEERGVEDVGMSDYPADV